MTSSHSLSLPTYRRTLLKGMTCIVLPCVAISTQGCGAGDSASTRVTPIGTLIAMKEIFTGKSPSTAAGVKDGEFLPGVLYGGTLIRSQSSLSLYWTHPVFANTSKPIVDFATQTLVVYSAFLQSPSFSIARISASQVIVNRCNLTSGAITAAVDEAFVNIKLIDVVLDALPKYENQREGSC